MIVCIGIAVFDIIFDINKSIEENKKNQAQGLRFNTGGNGINVAKVLNHYQIPVQFIGAIGDDQFGKLIYDELTGSGIQVLPDLCSSLIATPVSMIINNTTKDSRTILNYKNINTVPQPNFNKEATLIYSDGRFSEYTKQGRNSLPNIPIVWDWEREEHYINNKSLINNKDILICSEDFINELLGKYGNTEQEIVEFLYAELSFLSIIITKGAQGISWSTNSDKTLKNIPAIVVNALDTNGAGDVFHALFIYYYSKNLDIAQALTKANILTSQFVSQKGFLEALPHIK